MGTNFASDGYIWAGAETVYAMPMDNLVCDLLQSFYLGVLIPLGA